MSRSLIDAYFSHLVSTLGTARDVATIAIAHMVPNSLSFIPALNGLTDVRAVLPKPKSSQRPEYRELTEAFRLLPLSREWAATPTAVLSSFDELGLRGRKLVLLDIGGYFAQSIDELSSRARAADIHLLGVMEGTENGLVRYEREAALRTPIITVARSPLKLPEDYLVAASIVFSVEATLREHAQILQTRSAAVIGYGRVGSAVAEIMRGRGIPTVVFDTDPIKLAEAAARGFRVCRRLADALANATLVICATGKKSLSRQGFALLQEGAIVASVTSADDELDLASLATSYERIEYSTSMTEYREKRTDYRGRSFFLIADGNAANFLHGAVIGPAMQLIEGEKLAAVRELVDGKVAPGIHELGNARRTQVATIWNEHFLS